MAKETLNNGELKLSIRTKINSNFTELYDAVSGLTTPMSMKGGWDASTGSFPGGGTAQNGFYYEVTGAGTVGGISFDVGDAVVAIVNNASTSVYAGNWFKSDNTAYQTPTEVENAYNTLVAVATQAEAEAGSSTSVKRWTPQRIAQAIAALSSGGGGTSVGAVATTLCSNDTSDIVLETTLIDLDGNSAAYLDGKLVEAFVRLQDNVTAGYEQVWGIYTHATKTIARTNVGKSSAGYGIKHNWGSAARKIVSVTVKGSWLSSLATVLIDLAPHLDLLIAGSGQSNFHGYSWYANPANIPAMVDYVEDWSTNGSGGSRAYRVPNPTDHYSDFSSGDTYIGYPRTVLDGATWRTCGHVGYSFAKTMARFLGRKARTVFVSRPGTWINHGTYGWTYQPALSTSTAKILKDEIVAAVAALPAHQSATTQPHIFLWQQGETDATSGALGTTSIAYASMLKDFITDCEDPLKWGWASNKKTIYVIFDLYESGRERRPNWRGHELAKNMIGSRAILVDTQGATHRLQNGVRDINHIDGESADMWGARAANMFLSSAENQSVGMPSPFAFAPTKVPLAADAYYIMRAPGAGTPVAGEIILNATGEAATILRIAKVARASVNITKKLEHLVPYTILDFNPFFTSRHKYVTVTSVAKDMGAYFEYGCVVDDVGTAIANDEDFLVLSSDLPTWDGVSAKALAEVPFGSTMLSNNVFTQLQSAGTDSTNKYGRILAAEDGTVVRGPNVLELFAYKKGTTATANFLMYLDLPVGTYGVIDVECFGLNPADNTSTYFRVRAQFNATGPLGVVKNYPVDIVQNDIPIASGSSGYILFSSPGPGGNYLTVLACNGKGTTPIHWTVIGKLVFTPVLP